MRAARVIEWRGMKTTLLQEEWARLAKEWQLEKLRLLGVEDGVWVVGAGKRVDWARFAQRGLERRLRMLGYVGVELRFVATTESVAESVLVVDGKVEARPKGNNERKVWW